MQRKATRLARTHNSSCDVFVDLPTQLLLTSHLIEHHYCNNLMLTSKVIQAF